MGDMTETIPAGVEPPFVYRRAADRTAIITLNRPSAQNVLSVALMTALQAELDAIAEDDTIHVVVIRAEGGGFCAGHDLKEMHSHRGDPDKGRKFFEQLFAQCTRLMTTITALPQPVIAEVQGTAVAAGCQLVATCDMAVASENAQFGVNGIDVGFFCSTPSVALSRNIGSKMTMELLTTGEMLSANEGVDVGLVNLVVGREDLSRATLDLARKVAAKPRKILALGKKAFQTQIQMNREDAYKAMEAVMVENLMMEESVEGFSAFIEKRQPNWPE